MMKFSRTHIDALMLALVLTAALTLDSCRDELCYNHFSGLSLSLDWEQEWERDYGMNHASTWDASLHGHQYAEFKPGLPEWVNLVHFTDGSTSAEHFLDPDGGDVLLGAKGNHSFLLYNGDTEYIVLSDIASLFNARASATSRSRASISYVMERHPGVRSTNPPDMLYSSYIETLPEVGLHQMLPLPVKMQPLVFTYLVHYEFEYGFEHVRQARGALGGMAESVYLSNGRTSDETAIILYDCNILANGCEAIVRSFGIPGFPDEYYGRTDGGPSDRPFTLNLEVLLKNGKTVEFNFDIADQLARQPKGGVIHVSGIRIEDEQSAPGEGAGSGFDVDLSDWGKPIDIVLPIDM